MDAYKQYLQSPKWQEKRSERLKLDNYKCQRCGRPFDLEIHHITYRNIFDEDVSSDLITLCNKCHRKIEDEKKTFEPLDYNDQIVGMYIEKYKCKDVVFGGKENMCNRDVIKKYWHEMYGNYYDENPHKVSYIAKTTEYFRDAKIAAIKKWKSQGAEKSDIRRMGISEAMINKYY